jgi:hypothetical protein
MDASEGPAQPSRITRSHGLTVFCGKSAACRHSTQLDHGKDINGGCDLFLVIALGLGKSIILFFPLIAAQVHGERGIAFMIVLTKVLAEQQVHVVKDQQPSS